MVIIIATFGQAVAGQAKAINILGIIIVWRFIVSTVTVIRNSVLKLYTDGHRNWW